MGRVAGGFGASHVLFPPKGVEAQAERVFAGMMAMRQRVRALRPDVIVLAGSDHLNNFDLAVQVTLAIGVSDEYAPFGDTGLPMTPFPGNRAFAETMARHAAHRGFDLVQVEEAKPDHGMMIPRYVADPGLAVPIVPVWINAAMPIPPSPSRCYALGGVFKEAIEQLRPADERVVIIGHGGMSHWLATTGEGRVNAEFDLEFMNRMIAGRSAELADYSAEALVDAVGNGGLELTSWLFMAGALPGATGDKLCYEPVSEWISGMGGLALNAPD